eukprot:4653519-Alexandrium_andersonii.AAC.1
MAVMLMVMMMMMTTTMMMMRVIVMVMVGMLMVTVMLAQGADGDAQFLISSHVTVIIFVRVIRSTWSQRWRAHDK